MALEARADDMRPHAGQLDLLQRLPAFNDLLMENPMMKHDCATDLFRDIRLAHEYLERYREVCERDRESYRERARVAGDKMAVWSAKADACLKESLDISKWLERNKAYRATAEDKESQVDD